MILTITRYYESEVDYGDPYVELTDDNDDNAVILCGDYYHDKIESLIEGFICGLQYCGQGVFVKEISLVDEKKWGRY
jgi:hypothetical protein